MPGAAVTVNRIVSMTDAHQYFSSSADLGFLTDALNTIGNLRPDGEEERNRTYLDTFDWRLFGAGMLLWEDGRGRQASLVLAERDSGRERVSAGVRRKVRFAGDLPSANLRDLLAPVMEMRALLPVAEVGTRRTRLRLLDDNAKTVVRLVIDHPAVKIDARRQAVLPIRLSLQPVRGYDDWYGAVRRTLDNLDPLRPAQADMLTEALAAIGRRPQDYSSKMNVELDPSMSAAAAAVRIHRYLLDTLERNVQGTLDDTDSEFLHDFRVAVRRTRSALSQVKGVFPEEVTAHFRGEFGWLGQITGPTRDLDVYLLEYEKYRDSLPEAMRDDLALFHAFLVAHQRREQRRLRRLLQGERFGKLLADWRTFLDRPPAFAPEEAPSAALPVAEVASRRIWRMYRRVRKEGRAITPQSPASDLHELRKSCKKLRYLIEFFVSIYPEEAVKPLVKALKRLLDNLGEFQDLEVHADHLREFTGQMQAEGEVPLSTLLSMGGLVAGLLQRQVAAREVFDKRFKRFDVPENRAAYRSLFRAQTEALESR